MQRQRVAITGVGMLTALGTGGSEILGDLLESGRSGIAEVRAFSTEGLSSHLAAEVPADALDALIDRAHARRLSRVSQLAVAACRLALEDAAADTTRPVSLVLGTEFGDLRSTEEFAAGYLARGPVGLSPLIFPNTVMNAMAAATSIALGLRGACITLNARDVAGDLAIARAAQLVSSGEADMVLAGGVDELHPLRYAMLTRLGVLSPRNGGEEACRPYDRGANGAIHGEGATFLVLEAFASAVLRHARVLGEIRSAAWRANSRSTAVAAALATAGLRASEIGWIYGGSSGEPRQCAREVATVSQAFSTGRPALTSLAPVFGHHAGLGALRVAASALTASTGRLPGIASLQEPVAAARDLAVGPGVHAVAKGAGLVHGASMTGDRVAVVVAPA